MSNFRRGGLDRLAWTLLVLLATTPPSAAPAGAQAPGCGTDCATEPGAGALEAQLAPGGDRAARASAPGDFDFYVLALSWSAGFCKIAAPEPTRSQCQQGANQGFVVHGLWPQYEHGYPTECGPAGRTPSRIALDTAKDLYPDEGLARHEWRVHGTCSGKSPTDYFGDVRKARDLVVIPPPFREATSDQTWTPIDLERAFIAANPRLRPGMIGVACSRGVLQEVRICLSKDLRDFHACPEVGRKGCRAREVSVPQKL